MSLGTKGKKRTLDVSVAVTSTPDKKAQITRSQRQDGTVDGRVHEKRQRHPAGGATPFLHVFA
eukprot:6405634-Prorocentrum_lima.AAC.1